MGRGQGDRDIRTRVWVWSAICFKIMTRYTCGFFSRILAFIPATRYTCVFCHVYLRFIPKYMTIFLQTRIYMRTKKPIYMCYKQACGICGRRKSSYKGHRIMPSAKKPFHVRRSWKVTSVWSNARVNLEQIRSLFIALTVVVVVGSPTTGLLESVDCLLRDCVRYFTNADRNSDRFS